MLIQIWGLGVHLQIKKNATCIDTEKLTTFSQGRGKHKTQTYKDCLCFEPVDFIYKSNFSIIVLDKQIWKTRCQI